MLVVCQNVHLMEKVFKVKETVSLLLIRMSPKVERILSKIIFKVAEYVIKIEVESLAAASSSSSGLKSRWTKLIILLPLFWIWQHFVCYKVTIKTNTSVFRTVYMGHMFNSLTVYRVHPQKFSGFCSGQDKKTVPTFRSKILPLSSRWLNTLQMAA